MAKRITAFIFAVIMCFSVVAINASAKTTKKNDCCANYDLDELRAKFTITEYNKEEYAYYSPVKNKYDTKKYPVLVFLHGFGHETSYLSKSMMPYYASDYLQSQFKAGGCHIIIPQIWHYKVDAEQINNLVKDYIAKNKKNINTKEIILMGGSLGARKAYETAIANPGYYSDIVLACPAIWFKEEELKKISKTPIWLVSSKGDPLTGQHKDSWEILLKASEVDKKCRWTYFDGTVYAPDGKTQLSHFLAKYLGCDGYMANGKSFQETYSHVKVIDGTGKNASAGFIKWAENN